MGDTQSRPFSGQYGDAAAAPMGKDAPATPARPPRRPAGGGRRVRTPRPHLGSLCARGMPKETPEFVVVSRYQQPDQGKVLMPHFDEVKVPTGTPMPPLALPPAMPPPQATMLQQQQQQQQNEQQTVAPDSAAAKGAAAFRPPMRGPPAEGKRPPPPAPTRSAATCPNIEAPPKWPEAPAPAPARSISAPDTMRAITAGGFAASSSAVRMNQSQPPAHLKQPPASTPWPVAVPPPVRQEDTVIIFDWDDTLLCSTAISNGDSSENYSELEMMVKKILDAAMQLGSTLIVTNANELWVRESSKQYFPRLESTLERLRVISARERHEASWPGDVIAWKREAFNEVLRSRTSKKHLNLVVLGDSLAEICAAGEVASTLSGQQLVKTVKFMEGPSPIDLRQQLHCVLGELSSLVRETKSFSKALSRGVINPGVTPWVKPWGLCDWMAPTGQALRQSAGGITVSEQAAAGNADDANCFTL
mmetsp:Transcript_7345/g.16041  ORF Transcript_7345/g.16041 Transcript_7345/m.16041 type:complete len:475 (-) Transcript_7345:144-1568(-)